MKQNEYIIYEVHGYFYNSTEPDCIGFQLEYTANIGFGNILFHYNTKTEEYLVDTECMGKEFCLAVLEKWLDTIGVS